MNIDSFIPSARLAPAAVFCIALLAITLGGSRTYAQTGQDQSRDPAAIIEAIDAAGVTEFDFMDYVYEGTELSLGDNGSITLSYLRSCRVEQIKGGVVKIGKSQSEVTSSMPVEVIEVNCDGGGIVPTERQGEVAGLAFRSLPTIGDPPVKVYSTSPVFAFPEPVAELVIERAESGQAKSVRFPVNGRWLDLKKYRVSLEAGGTYRARAGNKSVLFTVSPNASSVGKTIVERLIGF